MIAVEKPVHAEIPSMAHRPQSAVVEVPVLIESRMLAALELAARERGVTTAALVRRLVGDFLAAGPAGRPG